MYSIINSPETSVCRSLSASNIIGFSGPLFFSLTILFKSASDLPCVLEITPQGDSKYYPIELLEIYDEEEGIQDDYKQRVNNKPFIDSQNNNTVSLNCVCKYFI